MRIYPKEYIYTAGKDAVLDADFNAAQAVGRVKLGKDNLFFKTGFKWYAAPFKKITRIFRRMDMVYGKLCCGGRTYDVQMLVAILPDGREMEIHIGDDMNAQAEELYKAIQAAQPQILYGKE
jgi:hypothetical protein